MKYQYFLQIMLPWVYANTNTNTDQYHWYWYCYIPTCASFLLSSLFLTNSKYLLLEPKKIRYKIIVACFICRLHKCNNNREKATIRKEYQKEKYLLLIMLFHKKQSNCEGMIKIIRCFISETFFSL